MVIFLFSAYFGGLFVTIALVKVELIPDLYTLAIVLIYYRIRRTLLRATFIFYLKGGPKYPLNARTPFNIYVQRPE